MNTEIYPNQDMNYPDDYSAGSYEGSHYPAGSGYMSLPTQDSSFLTWLFNFKNQTIEPLKHLWRGEEKNDKDEWVKSKWNTRVMNDKGVNWAISYIESFLSPVYVTSNYDEKQMFYVMRETTRSIINSLAQRHKEFALKKSDIDRVAIEMESKIQAILLGARGNGYRTFFSSTHQTTDSKVIQQQDERKRGLLAGLSLRRGSNNNS